MKILLVNPRVASGWRPYTIPPIGLCYLKSSLINNGFDTRILDASGLPQYEIADEIKEYQPDIVGVTVFTESRFHALDVVKLAKQINPKIITVLGGVHATFMHTQLLENYDYVDIVARGECEETMINLTRNISKNENLENVKGITFRNNGSIKVNDDQNKIVNLDKLPFPDYSDLDLKRYKDPEGPISGEPLAPVIASRGCSYNCVYCAAKAMWGNWRYRSIFSVLNEINWLIDSYGYRVINIIDDIFSFNIKRTEELCQGILDRGFKIKWKIQTRVDSVTLNLLKLMKASGCQLVIFGIESGSPTILKNLNKRESVEDIIRAFDCCREVGLKSTFNVIIGSPGETRETLNETKKLIWRTKPTYLGISNLRVYPGTPLWETGKYDSRFFLGKNETLYYTGAMKLSEMYRHDLEFLLLQARLGGFLDVYKFGIGTFARMPGKIFSGLLRNA